MVGDYGQSAERPEHGAEGIDIGAERVGHGARARAIFLPTSAFLIPNFAKRVSVKTKLKDCKLFYPPPSIPPTRGGKKNSINLSLADNPVLL